MLLHNDIINSFNVLIENRFVPWNSNTEFKLMCMKKLVLCNKYANFKKKSLLNINFMLVVYSFIVSSWATYRYYNYSYCCYDLLLQVFQQRRNGSVDFDRVWSHYENGFGDPNTEYWIGLFDKDEFNY